MTTLTASDIEEEVGQMERVNETELAEQRERRFLERQARHRADTALDPRVREWYLDRTIWDSTQAAAELGISKGRLFDLRGGRVKTRRQAPHPSMLPGMDTVEGYVAGRPSPGVEAGRIREWADKRGTHSLDAATGKLVKTAGSSHGRPRHGRLTLSKPHQAGQPRKRKSE